jgi:hypothetical protein
MTETHTIGATEERCAFLVAGVRCRQDRAFHDKEPDDLRGPLPRRWSHPFVPPSTTLDAEEAFGAWCRLEEQSRYADSKPIPERGEWRLAWNAALAYARNNPAGRSPDEALLNAVAVLLDAYDHWREDDAGLTEIFETKMRELTAAYAASMLAARLFDALNTEVPTPPEAAMTDPTPAERELRGSDA